MLQTYAHHGTKAGGVMREGVQRNAFLRISGVGGQTPCRRERLEASAAAERHKPSIRDVKRVRNAENGAVSAFEQEPVDVLEQLLGGIVGNGELGYWVDVVSRKT